MDKQQLQELWQRIQGGSEYDPENWQDILDLGPEASSAMGEEWNPEQYDIDMILEYLKAMQPEEQAPEMPQMKEPMVGGGNQGGYSHLADLNIWKARKKNPGGINTFSP